MDSRGCKQIHVYLVLQNQNHIDLPILEMKRRVGEEQIEMNSDKSGKLKPTSRYGDPKLLSRIEEVIGKLSGRYKVKWSVSFLIILIPGFISSLLISFAKPMALQNVCF